MSHFLRGLACWILALAFIASFCLLMASVIAIGAGLVLSVSTANPAPLLLVFLGLCGAGLFHLLQHAFDWCADRLFL